jgi:hypothetical protein
MKRMKLLNQIIVALAAVGSFILTGCGGDYSQGSVANDSPQAQQVARMIQTIRDSKDPATDPQISEQFSSEEEPDTTKALRGAVVDLARSPGLELASIDRFGDQVYRACFTYGTPPQTKRKTILLVSVEGSLRWAKVN